MAKNNLYQETFSHVRSSYEVNVEDFEKMKAKKNAPVKRIVLIAAAAAVLAAFGITAVATEFFGLHSVTMSDGGEAGLISMQGYADSDEYKALYDHYYGGLTLEEAAQKYGLTVPERCETFEYDRMAELLGGELMDERSTRWPFNLYGDGTFSADQDFTGSDGTPIGYQMFRSVKGSLTEIALNAMFLGDDYEEWNVKIGEYDVCLVLGGVDRSLIIADLGDSFFTANVLAGKRADPAVGGVITREQLEELAKSMNWDVLSRVVVPDFPPAPPVQYGAGVELLPEYIDGSQSFQVELPYYGKTRFISYLPTPEFDDVRFFLSADGKASDYEFHVVYNDAEFAKVAAVSFGDLDGDGGTDVLALIDYKEEGGGLARDIRAFRYEGDGEFELEWDLRNQASGGTEEDLPTVADVREMCKEHFAGGGDDDPDKTADSVLCSFEIQENGREIVVEAIGREGPYGGSWGVREIRIYGCDASEKKESEPFQIICPTDAGEDYMGGVYADYTECPSREDAVTALDMNFDGHADLGVFAGIPDNTVPCYYYWFWEPAMDRFEYAIALRGARVDAENRQVVAEYESGKAGSEYTCDTYEPDENGMLVLVDTRVGKYGDFTQADDYEGVLLTLQSQYADPSILRYGVFDLTGDGTGELIASFGNSEADEMCGVWSMDTGKLRKLGEFGMGHSQLYAADGKLTRVMGQMGVEIVSEIGFDGTEVTETTVSERQLGPEDEYRTFDTPFEMAPDSELWLLHGGGRYDGYADVLDDAGESDSYALFDMDHDGTKELIVDDGDMWIFWTAKDGKAVRIGELGSANSTLRDYGEGHWLAVFRSDMSSADISRVFLDGGKISTVLVAEWEWREDVASEDPGPEVKFLPVSDRSPLK